MVFAYQKVCYTEKWFSHQVIFEREEIIEERKWMFGTSVAYKCLKYCNPLTSEEHYRHQWCANNSIWQKEDERCSTGSLNCALSFVIIWSNGNELLYWRKLSFNPPQIHWISCVLDCGVRALTSSPIPSHEQSSNFIRDITYHVSP
jgi:hypothetical protein